MLLMISMLKKFRLFYEKELLKTNQQGFRMEKVIKKKEIIYMSNGTDMIIHLIAGLIRKT